MKGDRYFLYLLSVTVVLFLSACGTFQLEVESAGNNTIQVVDDMSSTPQPPLSEETQPEPTEEDTSSNPTSIRHTFGSLGISIEVPTNLYVRKEPLVKYDDQSKLDSYLFYIQNYGNPGGPSSGNFQMYGHLQYNLPPISWEQFAQIQQDSQMYEYVNEIEIDGLRGFDAQYTGQRNRFIYLFYLEGQVLTIAVGEPSPENKVLADQIIQSLKVIPGGFHDDSHVRLVSEPGGLFQILIPEDWEYDFQSTVGLQLTSFEATSPDFELMQVEAPLHTEMYYKEGIFLHVQVINDDQEPQFRWPDQRQYGVYFNGIPGTAYIFKEPSTAEGEIRTVVVTYEGRNYSLRFGYADDADLDTIDFIVDNFNITPDTYYPVR